MLLVLPPLAKEFQLAEQHIFRRCHPELLAVIIGPAAMLHGPAMQRIAHHEKEIGLKPALVVVKIQASALAAVEFMHERLVGRDVVLRFWKNRAQGGDVSHLEQNHEINVVRHANLSENPGRHRTGHAVRKTDASSGSR